MRESQNITWYISRASPSTALLDGLPVASCDSLTREVQLSLDILLEPESVSANLIMFLLWNLPLLSLPKKCIGRTKHLSNASKQSPSDAAAIATSNIILRAEYPNSQKLSNVNSAVSGGIWTEEQSANYLSRIPILCMRIGDSLSHALQLLHRTGNWQRPITPTNQSRRGICWNLIEYAAFSIAAQVGFVNEAFAIKIGGFINVTIAWAVHELSSVTVTV